MGRFIRNFFRLAAPPTALGEDTETMLIGQARERVSAVSEGRELLTFLDEMQYTLAISEENLPRRATAMCHAQIRHIFFSPDADADQIAGVLPHEAFHALQMEQVPSLLEFGAVMLHEGSEPTVYIDDEDTVELIHPDDMLYAYNLLEMGAYGMQSHIIHKMANEAGDLAVKNAAIRAGDECVSIYERVHNIDEISFLQFGDHVVVDAPQQNVVSKHGREAVATAVTGHYWFWNTVDSDAGVPFRLTYNDGKVDLLLRCTSGRLSPYFNMRSDGYKFDFRPLSRTEAELLGTGCGQSMFSLPDFADVTGANFRSQITDYNREKIAQVNRLLGLKLV